jgi:DNA-binding NarL/FixJ family response regulator
MTGAGLVKQFMLENRIGAHDLFVSKFAEHVRLRREAIVQLLAAGLKKKETARAMRCSVQSINYHTRPEWRKRKLDKRKGRFTTSRKFQMLAAALEEMHP